jgi:hypothetical protein
LDEVSARLPLDTLPARRARTVRDILSAYITDGDFVMDCISISLARMSAGVFDYRLFQGMLVDTLVQIRVHSWAPGEYNDPHQHTGEDWTATGVFHGKLRFCTYALNAAGKLEAADYNDASLGQVQLEQVKRIDADVGQVGFIGEDCIHNIENTSDDSAISFHFFTVKEPERPSETTVFTHPVKGPQTAVNSLDHLLCTYASLLADRRYGGPRPRELLEDIARIGGEGPKWRALKALGAGSARQA